MLIVIFVKDTKLNTNYYLSFNAFLIITLMILKLVYVCDIRKMFGGLKIVTYLCVKITHQWKEAMYISIRILQ